MYGMYPTKPDAVVHLTDRTKRTGVLCNAGARWSSAVMRSLRRSESVTCKRCRQIVAAKKRKAF